MRVGGEAFFLLNGWMNFLSLFLAARLARTAFRPRRCLAAALLGALYAMLAWQRSALWRALPALVLSATVMAAAAFGRDALRALAPLFAGGLLLSGTVDFLRRLLPAPWTLLLCGAAALGLDALLRQSARGGACSLCVETKRGHVWLSALVDSGNLLRDGVSGLPVIVAPYQALRRVLPPGMNPNDLGTLPRGYYLVRARTAAGERTLMTFHPARLLLRQSGKTRRVDAAVAVSDFRGNMALVPEALPTVRDQTMNGGIQNGL